MNIMTGINTFLTYINDNWTAIVIAIGLVLALIRKIQAYVQKSDDEKIEIAKRAIQQGILKMITDAELDYEGWKSAGSIKRSQVIAQIYEKYPVLSKIANQNEILEWIDTQIDDALVTLRDVISKNGDSAV